MKYQFSLSLCTLLFSVTANAEVNISGFASIVAGQVL